MIRVKELIFRGRNGLDIRAVDTSIQHAIVLMYTSLSREERKRVVDALYSEEDRLQEKR